MIAETDWTPYLIAIFAVVLSIVLHREIRRTK